MSSLLDFACKRASLERMAAALTTYENCGERTTKRRREADEDATTNDPVKDLDHANLSIALTRWNETMLRPAPHSRTALVSRIVDE